MAYEAMATFANRRFRANNYVIVNGFWRSGTTWVQEVIAQALKAKSVYEPLESRNRPMVEYTDGLELPSRDTAFINAYFPYAKYDLESNPALKSLLRRAIAGGWYGIWDPLSPPHSERSLAYSIRRRIVTKFVRANLCLGALQRQFAVPVIHIFRDPRAVVTSLLYPDPNWGGGTFQEFPLRRHMLEVPDGREDYYSRWRNEIIEIDKMPNLARLAGYYCLTERFLAESFDNSENKGLMIAYSTLLSDGFGAVFRFLEANGFLPSPENSDPERPSASDKRKGDAGKIISIEERLSGWRTVMSTSDENLVTSIAQQFELGSRCDS